jgi:hypothetical protein
MLEKNRLYCEFQCNDFKKYLFLGTFFLMPVCVLFAWNIITLLCVESPIKVRVHELHTLNSE